MFFTASELLPNRYELVLLSQQKAVLHRQTITVSAGLNVQTVTLPGYESAPASVKPSAPARRAAPLSATVMPDAAPVLTDNLPMLYFEEGSCVLSEAARITLQQVGSYLQQHPTVNLRLVGHTDRLGDERLNKYLGEYRAKVAANHLHWQWNIPDDRLEIVGFGSRFLVGAADNAESRGLNRRVSLKFIPAHLATDAAQSTTK